MRWGMSPLSNSRPRSGRSCSTCRPAIGDLLKAVFLEERDRDEVCREFGVDREYLRVLLFRAKQEFKTEYLKRVGAGMASRKKS